MSVCPMGPLFILLYFGDEMAEWLVSLNKDLMIASLHPTVAQGLFNLSSSEV